MLDPWRSPLRPDWPPVSAVRSRIAANAWPNGEETLGHGLPRGWTIVKVPSAWRPLVLPEACPYLLCDIRLGILSKSENGADDVTETANRLCRALTIATLVALLVLPGVAFSEEPTPAPQTSGTAEPAAAAEHTQANAAEVEANRLPPASTTHHTIRLGGETVAYSAKAGTLLLHDVHGKTLATVFYVAYMREP